MASPKNSDEERVPPPLKNEQTPTGLKELWVGLGSWKVVSYKEKTKAVKQINMQHLLSFQAGLFKAG